MKSKSVASQQWKPVLEYENHYEVSNDGIVRKIGTLREKKPQLNRGGYLCVLLWKGNKPKGMLIHVLVAQAFIGVERELELNHIDCNKRNNRASNLEYVTRRQNMLHAYDNELRQSGEKHRWAKLKEENVRSILSIHRSGSMGCRRLARQFGVAKATIQSILKGENWRQVFQSKT